MPLVCGKINQKILSFWTTYLSFCTRKMYPNTPVPEILCTAVLKGFFMEKYTGYSSDQISRSVVSDSLRPCESQHARPPCPSPTPGAYSNSCPSRQWCYPTISSSVIPFSSPLQSFSASGSFPLSRFFTSGGQSIGVSASACLSNEYSGLLSFRMEWLDLLAVQGTLKSLLQHHISKASILWLKIFPGHQISIFSCS